ncbi:hypothetical protein ABIC30_006000 [Methylobacterium sp. 1030]
MRTPWIIIRAKEGDMHCKRCGSSSPMPEGPLPVREFLAPLDRFRLVHAGCKDPVAPHNAQ